MSASDAAFDDAERLRRRQSGLDDDAVLRGGLQGYPACVVAKWVSGTGATGTCFTLEIQTVTGTETDGSSGAYTGTGAQIHAFNLGATVPASGSVVIAHRVDYRWVFRLG